MRKDRNSLINDLLETMFSTMRRIKSETDFPLSRYNLQRPHLEILFHLAAVTDKSASVKELAGMLHVTSGAITHFTDDLEQNGLIFRNSDSKDRRIMHITLSPQAQNNLRQFKELFYRKAKPLFKDLTDEELTDLMHLLNKIAA